MPTADCVHETPVLPTLPEAAGMISLLAAADRPPVHAVSPRNSVTTLAGQRPTILLVEDEPDTAFVQALVLELSGVQVRVAVTPPDALALAASHLFDVALIDIGLKHAIDGIELGVMLRELPGNNNLPLLALTGWQDEMPRAAAMGFGGYILKPVDLCHRLQVIAALIADRQT